MSEEAKPAEPTAEDLATHDFQTLLPKFYDKLEELSNRQLKRVVYAMMEYPLSPKGMHFSYPKEAELFELGMKLQDCKYVIMQAVFALKEDEVKALQKEIEAQEAEQAKKEQVMYGGEVVGSGNNLEEEKRTGDVLQGEGGRDTQEGSDPQHSEPS
jgi:hypothetical protein